MEDRILKEKAEQVIEKYKDLERALGLPENVNNPETFTRLNREFKRMIPVYQAALKYLNWLKSLEEVKELLSSEDDSELIELAKEELRQLEAQEQEIIEKLKLQLVPKDPDDDKPAILEIRAGTGGDEAALFAGDLLRMYQRYAERKGWKFEITDYTEGNVGGYKEVIVHVSGEECYGHLKYEAGVHRVQRIPKTESQGRIHTSAASVAVLPEPEEIDIKLDMKDIKKETFCSSGPGGQSVNTTYSAVRLTHLPTGIVVAIQNERSQIKNYEMALKILKAKLYELEIQKKMEEEAALRRSFISTGDRSAKIRTYNFPQNRVTDHRINLTLYNLQEILDGDLDPLIEALQIEDRAKKLAAMDSITPTSP